jgi:hypothetical protein
MRGFASRSAVCILLALTSCRSSRSDLAESADNSRDAESADTAGAESPGSKSAWSLVCNFDSASAGTIPTGFTPRSGEWSIVEDATAPSPAHALAQTGKSDNNSLNLIVMDDVKQADVELDVKIKAVAGETEQGGGVGWRIHDAKNGYFARISPLEHTFRVYKFIDGEKKQLQSSTVQVTPGWHELRIAMHGDSIRGYFDGRSCITAHDTSFTAAGKVGLWTKSDAQTRFDDLKVGEVH